MGCIETLPHATDMSLSAVEPRHVPLPHLVGQVYESGPPTERCQLLEHLMSPLGALSLALIANGVFANMRFRNGWQEMHVHMEDAQKVRAEDVIALTDRVQQINEATVDALSQKLAAWPVMAGSSAAVALMAGIMQRNPGLCFHAGEDDDAP